MINLHDIKEELSELDKAAIWWFAGYSMGRKQSIEIGRAWTKASRHVVIGSYRKYLAEEKTLTVSDIQFA